MNESEESQGSQELAKLLAGGHSKRAVLDRDPQDRQQATIRSSHLPDHSMRQNNLLAPGQGQPVNDNQHKADDSQKENYHSSIGSPKFGPSAVRSPSESPFIRLKISLDKNRAVSSQPFPTPLSGRELSASGTAQERPLCQPQEPPSQATELVMSERETEIYHASHLDEELQSQESRVSQGSDASQDDEALPQAQIVFPITRLSELSEESQSFEGNQSQPQSFEGTQTQSTQPQTQSVRSDDESQVSDQEWGKHTGLQVPSHLRNVYLQYAKQGAALTASKENQPSPSSSSSRDVKRQYPAGTPDPSSSNVEEETQLLDEFPQHPVLQFPAGAPASEDEGMETQIVTQTEDEDVSSIDNVSIVAHASSGLPSAGPPPAFLVSSPEVPLFEVANHTHPRSPSRAPKESPNMEIVPDSEPPSMSSPEVPLYRSVAETKRNFHSSRLTEKSAEKEIVPDSEPPAPSVHSTKDTMSAHGKTSQSQPNTMNVDAEDDNDEKSLFAIASGSGGAGVTQVGQMSPLMRKVSTKAEGKRRQVVPADYEDALPKHRVQSYERKDIPAYAAATVPSFRNKQESSNKKGGPKIKAKGKEKAKQADPSRASARKSTRTTRNRRNLKETDEDSDEAVTVNEDGNAFESSDEDDATSALSDSTRKRKRVAVTPIPRKALKLKSPSVKHFPVSQGSTSMDTSKGTPASEYRVLGLWDDGHWYPGSVVDYHRPDSFYIRFDDGSGSSSRMGSLRRLELRIGDDVINRKNGKKGKVLEVKEEEEEIVMSIAGRAVTIPYPSICISPDKVETQWADRMLNDASLEEILHSTAQSALPEGVDRFLAQSGIIVTCNTSDPSERDAELNAIYSAMAENGATLIEDWTDGLTARGTSTPTGWRISKDEVRWFDDLKKSSSLQRVFVIAEADSTKPKYLIGLALGVPCLSSQYLLDNLAERKAKDWQSYLLPQGTFNSPSGPIRVSQRVDLDWGTKPEHLTNIMDNPIASKLFEGMSVLCIGKQYMPKDKAAKPIKMDIRHIVKASIASGIPLIILAMGASQVTVVIHEDDTPKGESFDYVVSDRTHKVSKDGSTYVTWEWVKQALICGKMTPL